MFFGNIFLGTESATNCATIRATAVARKHKTNMFSVPTGAFGETSSSNRGSMLESILAAKGVLARIFTRPPRSPEVPAAVAFDPVV